MINVFFFFEGGGGGVFHFFINISFSNENILGHDCL